MLTSKQVSYLALITTALVLILVILKQHAKMPATAADLRVASWDDIPPEKAEKKDWGEIKRYFQDGTYGTDNVVVGVGKVEPHKTVAKSHRHGTEEYLIITQGKGLWTLDGKDRDAKVNDVLYASPWASHGLINNSDEPLTFVYIVYSGKGVKACPKPNDGKPDAE